MKVNSLLVSLTLGLFVIASSASAQDRTNTQTDRAGNTMTIRSGQPAPVNYGPAPSYEQLDPDHDGIITREEAATYPPLLNDFDFIAHHANTITRKQYERWVATQTR
jgi:hypothetical protein